MSSRSPSPSNIMRTLTSPPAMPRKKQPTYTVDITALTAVSRKLSFEFENK